jgi:hypothetical protein
VLEFLLVALFCWLFFKAIGLAFRLTWGAAKIAAALLLVAAAPLLILFLVAAGGFLLLIPLAMVAIAATILRMCVC